MTGFDHYNHKVLAGQNKDCLFLSHPTCGYLIQHGRDGMKMLDIGRKL